jgi:hypothetical protein
MHRATLKLASMLVLFLGACDTPQHAGSGELPTIEAIVRRQADRAEKLSLLESGGTIELRTTTEDGKQFEDCALELWRDGPRLALRARKLGERFLWVGTDGEQWWVFQLAGGPVRVIIQQVEVGNSVLLDDGVTLTSPSQLLALAGLNPIEPLPGASLVVREAPGVLRFDLVAGATGTGTRLRWFIDEKTLLPQRIQALDDDGAVLLESRLSGYEPIPARDTPLGGWPDFPRKVRLMNETGTSDVRIFFNRPSARGTGIKPALFDLERLMQAFRPVEVKYVE